MARETVSQTNWATYLTEDLMAPTVTGSLWGTPAGHIKATWPWLLQKTRVGARLSRLWGNGTSS